MKWFKNWFQKQVKEAIEITREEEKKSAFVVKESFSLTGGKLRINGDYNAGLGSQSITFNLYRATGGTIIEMSEYDEAMDRHRRALHVVPTGEELGPAITKIITFEGLKR